MRRETQDINTKIESFQGKATRLDGQEQWPCLEIHYIACERETAGT